MFKTDACAISAVSINFENLLYRLSFMLFELIVFLCIIKLQIVILLHGYKYLCNGKDHKVDRDELNERGD